MKPLNLFMKLLILTSIFTGCDATSTQNGTTLTSQEVPSNIHQTDHNEATNDQPCIIYEETVEVLPYVEWQPAILSTPGNQNHKDLIIPDESLTKAQSYFINNIDSSRTAGIFVEKESDGFHGVIEYCDATTLYYYFITDNDKNYIRALGLVGYYELSQNGFSESNKAVIYKMLDIVGVDDQEAFFQELLDSPKITDYEGCIVQLKPAPYAMIDLTYCEADGTSFRMYNPELKE